MKQKGIEMEREMNKALLNNTWAKKEVSRGMEKFLLNENKITTCHNL